MSARLTEADFAPAAASLSIPVAAVKAVCSIEAPKGGFDSRGQPRILFEGHIFSHLTGGVYDKTNPTISYPRWTRQFYAKGKDDDARNAGEHDRLQQAVNLRRAAALMSASWGLFQIMGENYATAGYASLQDFINAMYKGEGEHLKAFVEFIKHDRGGRGWVALKNAVATGDWVPFAEFYNGEDQAKNQYAPKLSAAFKAAS